MGLSTAWPLQRQDIGATVANKAGPAAGPAAGQAGAMQVGPPSLVRPLAAPGAWKYALQGLMGRNVPLQVPASLAPASWRSLLQFASNMTTKPWERAMRLLQPTTSEVNDWFDEVKSHGIASSTVAAPLSLGLATSRAAAAVRAEIEHLPDMGQIIDVPTAAQPSNTKILSPVVPDRLELSGQSFLDPGEFAHELARSFKDAGGRILEDATIMVLSENEHAVEAVTPSGERVAAEIAVITTGAWPPGLAAKGRLRLGIRAGRGYIFTADGANLPGGTLHLPEKQ